MSPSNACWQNRSTLAMAISKFLKTTILSLRYRVLHKRKIPRQAWAFFRKELISITIWRFRLMTEMVAKCFLFWFWIKKSLIAIKVPTRNIILLRHTIAKQTWPVQNHQKLARSTFSKILTTVIRFFLPPTSRISGTTKKIKNRRLKTFFGITMILLRMIQKKMGTNCLLLNKSSIYKIGQTPTIRMNK